MKKIFSAVLVLTVLSSFVFAETPKWNFEAGAGYAYVSMGKVNDSLQDLKNVDPTSSLTKISGGLDANINFMYQSLDFLKIGPRVGFTMATKGSVTEAGDEYSYVPMLIPLEIGATINIALKDMPFGIVLSGFGGYGMALVNNTRTADLGASSITPVYYGGAPVFDFMGGIYITPLALFEINANIGYKIANIPELKNTKAVKSGILEAAKDEQLHDLSNKAMPVDFSGINFKLGVSFKF